MDCGRALNEMILLELWTDEKYVTNLDRINTHTQVYREIHLNQHWGTRNWWDLFGSSGTSFHVNFFQLERPHTLAHTLHMNEFELIIILRTRRVLLQRWCDAWGMAGMWNNMRRAFEWHISSSQQVRASALESYQSMRGYNWPPKCMHMIIA